MSRTFATKKSMAVIEKIESSLSGSTCATTQDIAIAVGVARVSTLKYLNYLHNDLRIIDKVGARSTKAASLIVWAMTDASQESKHIITRQWDSGKCKSDPLVSALFGMR